MSYDKILELIRESKDKLTLPGFDEKLAKKINDLFPLFYSSTEIKPDPQWFLFDKLPELYSIIDVRYQDGTIAFSRLVGEENLTHYKQKASYWKFSDQIIKKQNRKRKF